MPLFGTLGRAFAQRWAAHSKRPFDLQTRGWFDSARRDPRDSPRQGRLRSGMNRMRNP